MASSRKVWLTALVILALGTGWRLLPAPLTASTSSAGIECVRCNPKLAGPWVRVELENHGFAPVRVQNVSIQELLVARTTTTLGITSSPDEVPLSPSESQTVWPLDAWRIRPGSEHKYAVHIGIDQDPRNIASAFTVEITYRYLFRTLTVTHVVP